MFLMYSTDCTNCWGRWKCWTWKWRTSNWRTNLQSMK